MREPTEGRYLGSRCFQRLRAAGADRDMRSGRRETQCDRAPDPAAPPGDDDALPSDIDLHEPTRLGAALAHEKDIQLVAVQIAKVAGIESLAARSDRAFVLATECERFLVHAVDFLARIDDQRDHHAVADGSRLAVVGFHDAEARLVLRDSPGYASAEFPQAFGADLAQQCVVESCCTWQIIGAERCVADHLGPLRLLEVCILAKLGRSPLSWMAVAANDATTGL